MFGERKYNIGISNSMVQWLEGGAREAQVVGLNPSRREVFINRTKNAVATKGVCGWLVGASPG